MARPECSNPQARLFIGNVPFKATREEVVAVFEQIGPVADSYVPRSRRPDGKNLNQGFAFVEMKSVDDASRAIALHGIVELQGRQLLVRLADRRSQ